VPNGATGGWVPPFFERMQMMTWLKRAMPTKALSTAAATSLMLGAAAASAWSQSGPSDAEGYSSLVSCAALFTAVGGVSEGQDGKDALDLATSFMTGAILIAPGGNTDRAEREFTDQTELFAVALLDETQSSDSDITSLSDSCVGLAESYLPEILARAQ